MSREKLVQRSTGREVACEDNLKAAYEVHKRAKGEQAAWNKILELHGLGMDRGTEGRFGNAVLHGGHDNNRDHGREFRYQESKPDTNARQVFGNRQNAMKILALLLREGLSLSAAARRLKTSTANLRKTLRRFASHNPSTIVFRKNLEPPEPCIHPWLEKPDYVFTELTDQHEGYNIYAWTRRQRVLHVGMGSVRLRGHRIVNKADSFQHGDEIRVWECTGRQARSRMLRLYARFVEALKPEYL